MWDGAPQSQSMMQFRSRGWEAPAPAGRGLRPRGEELGQRQPECGHPAGLEQSAPRDAVAQPDSRPFHLDHRTGSRPGAPEMESTGCFVGGADCEVSRFFRRPATSSDWVL